MIIQPKIRGFICTTAHPIGCQNAVLEQINYVKRQGTFSGPKNVLIIGASTGYGLASRIVATFGAGAKTVGVFFEKAADEKRTATAGWYNTAAFEQFAHAQGYYAKSINGDAFSDAVKAQAAEIIRQDLGKIDLIIYSLASPRRVHPRTGSVFQSALKPIGKAFKGKTVDTFKGEVKEVTIEPATPEEINHTIAVMGGEDWEMWIDYLKDQDLLASNVKAVAYSYLGPELTFAIYKDGTIGQAKADLKNTADKLKTTLEPLHGDAFVSVEKAVVTQASAAIPVVPLYMSLLFKIMKRQGTHEGCIEQMVRLFKDKLCVSSVPVDQEGYIRVDDLEMDPAVQSEVAEIWSTITSENVKELSDIAGYCNEFYRLFGFNIPGVDYSIEVNPHVEIPSLSVTQKT